MEPSSSGQTPELRRDAARDLDPRDWDGFRVLLHEAVDRLADQLQSVRRGPVWRAVPDDAKAHFSRSLPRRGVGARAAFDLVARYMLPYATGNQHPRFMGWVHGAGTPGALLAAMSEATINANVGGRDHAAIYVERQVLEWMRNLFGFPPHAGGILTSGTSMATVIALAVAREAKAGWDVAAEGMRAEAARYRLYASEAAHNSTVKALKLLGFGSRALIRVPTTRDGAMNVRMLADIVAADRRRGLRSFCVVATAGSVDTGAIDDLAAIADVAKANDLWLHVDGAFGALGALVPELAPRLHGIERADSLAFDLHKWAQVTYECGCVLVRDGELHRRTFAAPASYLGTAARGLAGGAPWFCDFGPELSRGFRALKAWFLFTEHGAEAIADAIRRTCMLAEYLASRVREDARLELLAAHGLNIVCFRVRPPPGEDADCFNARLVEELQMSGAAAPSTTHIRGVLAIRCCIVNHRTTRKDIDILLRAIARIVARSAPRRSVTRRTRHLSSVRAPIASESA